MKKITLLLTFLCAFLFSASASAQTNVIIESVERATKIEPEEWYIMESRWLDESVATTIYENDEQKVFTSEAGTEATQFAGRLFNDYKSSLIRFVLNEDGVTYKIQFGTGRYIKKVKGTDVNLSTTNESENIQDYYINIITGSDNNNTFQFGTTNEGGYMLSIGYYDDVTQATGFPFPGKFNNVETDKENEIGSEWILYKATVNATKKKVTVQFVSDEPNAPSHDMILGNDFYVGDEISLKGSYIPNNFANGLISFDDQKIIVSEDDAKNTVTVNYTTKVPYAKDFVALGTEGKWVSFYSGNARAFLYDKDATNGFPVIDNATFMNLDDDYFWGFICENPFTSPLYIVNKGAGSGKYLQLSSSTISGVCQMTDATTNERVEWTLEPATQQPTSGNSYDVLSNYFGIKCVGTTLYIGNYLGKGFMKANKKSPNEDAGAGFKFSTELETYRTLAERALTAPEGAINSLKTEYRATIGDVQNMTLDNLQSIVKNHDGNIYVEMVPGAYYRILNWQNHNEANAKVISFNGTNRALDVIDNRNVDQLWKIEADGTDYQFKNANLNKYFNRPSIQDLLDEPNSQYKYTLKDIGAGQHFLIVSNGNVLIGTVDSNEELNGFSLTSSNYKKNSKDAWYLIPVNEFEVKLNDGGNGNHYATAHFPFDVMVENAKAYVATSVNAKNKLIMEEVTDKIIPANTALVIIGKEETATVKIKGVTTETEGENGTDSKTETWAGTNVLSGTNLDLIYGSNTENITKDDVLIFGKGKDSGKVGFFKPSSSDKVTMIRHNSAYLLRSELHTDSDQAVTYATFSFAGDETGIDNVEADTDDEAVTYDMQGRRVNNPSKGVYIVNGKKVLF